MERFIDSLSNFLKELQELVSTVINAVETDDELGTVLRFHWLIEAMLVEYLKEKRRGDIGRIVREPRDFGMKLALSAAFGMPLPIAKVIYQINLIRNKIAHSKSTCIENGDLKELVRLVNKLEGLGVMFTPVQNRYLVMPIRNPSQKFMFGQHGNRIDFAIACFGFYEVFIRWYPTESKKET